MNLNTFGPEVFDKDYFINGLTSGKSLYENYRWMPQLTTKMVQSIIDHLGIRTTDRILDFGCARGYTVKAFKQLGYDAMGIDISEWAIANADQDIAASVSCGDAAKVRTNFFDWIIAKDVLEHIEYVDQTIDKLLASAKVGVLAVIPLSAIDGEPYIVAEYEKDITHIHRLTLASWARMFMRPGWRVEAMYRLAWTKDNYKTWENGNGFITTRRIS